jgi:peptidyl-prolyl cis-trans isomerase SurA
MTKNNKFYTYLFSFVILTLIVIVLGCSGKKKDVVAEVGDEKIYLYEFESSYLKSVGNNVDTAKKSTLQQRKDFLNLMIKLRLKVKDAKDKGYLNLADVQEDLKSFKKSYLSTFLIDKEVVEPNIKDLYEKKKYEVRASHILVNLTATPTPEDSVKAYQKAEEIEKRLKNGDDFSTVAMEMSDDQSAKNNGGDLYYFTGGMTVPEFEDAVYNLKVGDYTKKPVRTMFGLHIVKLTDKKKRCESIRASHILIQDIKDSVTGKTTDTITSYNKIKEVYDRIKKGEDFAQLASEFSQDPGTKTKGGDLGFFDRRRMIQPFDSAAFSLKAGEVSGVVRTPYGWHIIKVTEIKEYQPYEKQHETLKSEFKRSMQYRTAYDKYVGKCRKDYKFEIKQDGFRTFASKLDSTQTIGSLKMDSLFTDQDKQIVVAEFKGGSVKIGDIMQFLIESREMSSNAALNNALVRLVESAADKQLLNLIADKEKIEKEDEYVELYKEYEAGLLRSKVDNEEISSKIKITDEDIDAYYSKNIQKYTFAENNEQKVKTVEEVKGEISQALQTEKFTELENAYVEKLKQKYPVKIFDNALEKAFKD